MALADPKEDVMKVLIFVVIIFFIWVLNGGPNKDKQEKGIFHNILGLNSTSTRQESINRRDTVNQDSSRTTPAERSSTQARVDLEQTQTAYRDFKDEYITIRAKGSKQSRPINITGWQVRSDATGRTGTIGGAVEKPFIDSNIPRNIFLEPNDRAYLITGKPPLGFSFRLNKCMGYLSQVYTFRPALPTNCPHVRDDRRALSNLNLGSACEKYIVSSPRCEQPTRLSRSLPQACRDYITRNMNYNSCVAKHQNDTDFYKREWYIYLNRTSELWRSNDESFQLINAGGYIVDQLN